MNYWLMKSEPDVFSWGDLEKKRRASWDGVRNFQARNFMRDRFRIGDLVLFYHSSCAEPGIVGIARVVKEAYPDPTALDPKSDYYDPASAKAGTSRWFMVDIEPVQRFKHPASLSEIRSNKALQTMLLLRKGQRLSIQPVTEKEYKTIKATWG